MNPFYLLFLLGIISLIALSAWMGYLWRSSQKKLRQTQEKLELLQSSVEPMKLENLQAKLNPHLFKNILNSIQSHAFQTYQSLDQLGNVLDYILYESNRGLVSPKEEIQFAQSLIEINKVKLSPLFELQVKVKVDESDPVYTQRCIAPLVLVDLIENAFKHTDLQNQDSFIRIHLSWGKDGLALMVSNKISSRSPLKKPHSGIGSQTLEQRLDILHPGAYKLKKFQEDDKFIAQLTIQPHGKKA